MSRTLYVLAAAAVLAGCAKKAAPPVYQAIPVARRDIIVSAQASGSITPDTLIEVRSQASGEVTQIKVQTGDLVHRGDLMVEIDPRTARNNVEQAQAALDVAKASLENATSAKNRADTLFLTQSISEQDREAANLTFANAKADLVRARVSLENARIALEQTEVKSPIEGTVITKTVERGSVITSSTQGIGGGTVLMTTHDLRFGLQSGDRVLLLEGGRLVLDPASRRYTLADGGAVSGGRLTPGEAALIVALARRPGQVLTREQLLESVARRPDEVYDRVVDVHVANLRRKLGDDAADPWLIETIPHTGYRLVARRDGG